MVLEIEAFDLGERRHGVDAFLAPGAEQLQGPHVVHLRVIELGDRRRRHQVAVVHQHRVVVGRVDLAEAGDVFVELDVHDPVFGQGVHLARFGLARLDPAQRLRDRHLINDDLVVAEGRFRDAVAGLDEGGVRCMLGRCHAGRAGEEVRMLTALVVSSAPWSMTLSTSSRPMIEAVTWMPPVPQP